MAGALPPLSPTDRDTYARMGTTMEWFHNNFRNTWKVLYGACSSGKRPANMSIRQFLNTGSEFAHHLTMHHTIEEQHIFPVLAQKMPAFKKELELLTQHKQIHNGLDKFEAYIDDCKAGKRDMRMNELKEIMDSFGTVLWAHLQDEVDQLSVDNMRKYWSLDEAKRFRNMWRKNGVGRLREDIVRDHNQDRVTLEREWETYNEHVRSMTADPEKRSADMEEEKSTLQRALQTPRALERDVEEMKLAKMALNIERDANAKNIVSQFRIERNQMVELQAKLDTKTAELLQEGKEATGKNSPDVSHGDLYAILSHHRRSQEPQELASVVEEGAEDDGEDLAGMLKRLLTSHARAVTEARIAKDRQRVLQQANKTIASGSLMRRHRTQLTE
ncbi:hypothetical protein HO133_007346 [Letharia lupina]|uniref:Hemerythrin-like domain-containing protein n=1 Tax=Letharia lupina TaxID=560253 RepID=A0A8H6KYL9_9LECA|nr:uncharacterized protein HO133_007346 [Letharia lupina]KAF6229230.1 hypothetical protein HO133_007346 [Letharia lupina]